LDSLSEEEGFHFRLRSWWVNAGADPWEFGFDPYCQGIKRLPFRLDPDVRVVSCGLHLLAIDNAHDVATYLAQQLEISLH
jgi:hypothetical protein